MLCFWAAATGLALAVTAQETPLPSIDVDEQGVKIEIDLKETDSRFNAWSDFEGPLTQDTAWSVNISLCSSSAANRCEASTSVLFSGFHTS
jgi:hypothetical protein